VRFSNELERNAALTEMNGHFLSNRPIRVSLATAKKTSGVHPLLASQSQLVAPYPQPLHPSDLDPTNTTLFIGGLSGQVMEEQLRGVFSQFGEIIYVKIPHGKGCGFVQFVLRTAAERAIMAMNGKVLGNSAMRISWGRSSSRSNSLSGPGALPPVGGVPPPAQLTPSPSLSPSPSPSPNLNLQSSLLSLNVQHLKQQQQQFGSTMSFPSSMSGPGSVDVLSVASAGNSFPETTSMNTLYPFSSDSRSASSYSNATDPPSSMGEPMASPELPSSMLHLEAVQTFF